MTIYVDASDTGWGVTSTVLEKAGHWSALENEDTINVRELKAILLALQLHGQKFKNGNIQVMHERKRSKFCDTDNDKDNSLHFNDNRNKVI